MMTMNTLAAHVENDAASAAAQAAQKVVIVNGSVDILAVLESVMDAGHYNVVFVESCEHAYSHIKRLRPELVILCVQLDDAAGFNVLSMLKLDRETRDIPLLTYTTQYDGSELDDEVPEPEAVILSPKATAVLMN